MRILSTASTVLLCAAVVVCTASVVWAIAHPYKGPLLHDSYGPGWLAVAALVMAMIGVFLFGAQMSSADAPARNKTSPHRENPEPGIAPGSASHT